MQEWPDLRADTKYNAAGKSSKYKKMSRFPPKEQTVPQCICISKHFNPNCFYATEEQLLIHAEVTLKEGVYKNLGNPEDMLE